MTVRPMQRSDLEGVASLYERVVRSGTGRYPGRLRSWFERALFENPGVDEEIPSLVADDGDRITGFLASHPRPMSIDGRPGRLACSGQLVVDPRARSRATGAILLKAYLDGPQDLTITDGATDLVRAIWERLGGRLQHPQSMEWMKPLRPASLGAALLARRRDRPLPGRVAGGLAGAADLVLGRLPDPGLGRRARSEAIESAKPTVRAEPLGAEALAEALPELAARCRLRPDYDAELAAWLLSELSAVGSRGELRARLLRGDDDRPLGLFVYFLLRRGLSSTIAIAAVDEPAAAASLDALLEDARSGGAAGVHGRLDPLLVVPAASRGCLTRYVGQALVHARDPEVLGLLSSRQALLTRLEGEWWMDPHLL